MKRNGISLALILLGLTGLNEQPTFKHLYQLAGTWKMEAAGKSFYENWQIKADNEMHGRSYKVNATDTLVLEDVQLLAKGKVIYYIPIVTGQNGGQPVSFKLIGSANHRFVFENEEHDFPQRVIYHLVSKDSLHAWIEGKQNGQEKRSDFYYRRVN